MKKLLTIASLLITSYLTAQTGIKVDEANTNRTPNASAIFDAEATTKGILIPQLSLSATNVAAPVTTPANSLLIYNTATAGAGTTAVSPGYYYWDTLTDVWVRLLDPTNNVVTVDSAEWIDGSLVGLNAGDIYARRALANGDTTVFKGSGAQNGSLGLGVPNPTAKLHVKGYARFIANGGVALSTRNEAGDKGLDVSNGSSYLDFTSSANRWFINRNAPTRLDINKGGGSVNIGKSLGTYPAQLVVRGKTADATDNALMVTDSNDFPTKGLLTVRNDGYVGVGTTTPYGQLHVYDSIDGVHHGLIVDNRKTYGVGQGVNETSRVTLSLSEDGTQDPLNRIMGYVEAGTEAETSSEHGFLAFGTRDNPLVDEKMRITSLGRVGIGTSSPSYKLHVVDTSNAQIGQFIQNTNSTGASASEILLVGQGSLKYGYLAYHNDSYSNGSYPNLTPNTTLLFGTQDLAISSGSSSNDIKFGNAVMNNQSMVIKGNGDVGIGTMTPENNLHLHVGSMGASSEKGLTIEGYGNSGTDRGVQIQFKTGTAGLASQKSGAIKVTRFNTGNGTDMSFYTRNDAGDSVQAMLIDENGNVGIGSIAPLAQLAVNQSGPAFVNQLRLENDSTTLNSAWRIRIPGSGTGTRDGALEFVTASAQVPMMIEAGGDVGIGTTNPIERLEVVGNVRASGNFISGGTTLTVPDYVFEKYYEGKSNLKEDYTFRSLEEIEQYTKENKHLPGITSAKEIKDKNEFNITQSSLNNLEKIEELYLHVIELNKENNNLKLEVERLKNDNKEVESLKKEVEEIKILLKELQKQ